MKLFNWRNLVGAGLILLGGLFLLQQLQIIKTTGVLTGLLFSVLFAGGGMAFLSVVIRNRENWWAVIPGVVLISLGVVTALGTFGAAQWGGTVFMAGISLAFWLVFALARENWWAIIPAGVLLTMAVITALTPSGFFAVGGVFFLGLALTFALVAVLPAPAERMSWPWIPASVLLVLGILTSLAATELVGFVLPVTLIIVGLFLIFRSLIRRGA